MPYAYHCCSSESLLFQSELSGGNELESQRAAPVSHRLQLSDVTSRLLDLDAALYAMSCNLIRLTNGKETYAVRLRDETMQTMTM